MNWTMEWTNEITGERIRAPIYGFVLSSGIRLKVGVFNTNYQLDYWISNKGPEWFQKGINLEIVVRFLALVTTMITMVDHGNHRSNDRSNHRGYYDRYYNVNAWFLHLLPRILPYLMTIRFEMNQILSRTIKNHLKRHIFG